MLCVLEGAAIQSRGDADVSGLTKIANATAGQEYAGTPQNIKQVQGARCKVQGAFTNHKSQITNHKSQISAFF